MDLNRLADERINDITRTIAVGIGDQTLNAVIRPGGITPATQLRLMRSQSSGLDDSEAVAEFVESSVTLLTELVVSWDVDANGVPLPITREALTNLPTDILQLLTEAVMAGVDGQGKETSGSSKPASKRAVKRTPNS